MGFCSKKLLRIDNIEIIVGEETLCRGQSLSLYGIYGVVGSYNKLRNSLLSLLTVQVILDVTGLKFSGEIFYGGQVLKYCELQELMNPFVVFHSEESVKSSLELVNFLKAKELIEVFGLVKVKETSISRLSIAESRAWETAICIASNARLIILRDFQTSHELLKKYLTFLREYVRARDCVILLEMDSPVEYGLDGCVIVGKNTFECIDFSRGIGLHRCQGYYMLHLLDEKIDNSVHMEKNVAKGKGEFSTNPQSENVTKSSDLMEFRHLGVLGRERKSCKQEVIDRYLDFYSKEPIESDRIVYNIKSKDDFRKNKNLKNSESKRRNTHQVDGMWCKVRYCRARKMTFLERIFTLYFYSVDIRTSLLLARRRYIFKDRKVENLERFFLSLLCQIYLTILVNFKGSLLQNTFDFVFTIPRFLHLVLGLFKVGVSLIMNPNPLKDIKQDSSVLHLVSRFMTSTLDSLMIIGWKTKSFFALVRSFSWDSADYKVISTGIYFLVFMKGGTIANEERMQVYSYLNKIYSPGTYFVYMYAYIVLTTWIPILIISYVLNFGFAFVFLITGTFICSLLNLIFNMKLKYLCVCVILAFNLLYPLGNEQFQKGFFFRYSESFNLLVACREFPFATPPEKLHHVYCLVRAFVMTYIFFCYKLSRV